MVSLQVAASAVGSAALPAGLGLVVGAVGAWILAPSLLALGLAMGGLYAFLPARLTTVMPAPGPGSSIAASARPASSSPITWPTSRPGRSVPSATSPIIAG